MVFLKYFFEKVDFKNKTADVKMANNITKQAKSPNISYCIQIILKHCRARSASLMLADLALQCLKFSFRIFDNQLHQLAPDWLKIGSGCGMLNLFSRKYV